MVALEIGDTPDFILRMELVEPRKAAQICVAHECVPGDHAVVGMIHDGTDEASAAFLAKIGTGTDKDFLHFFSISFSCLS